MLFVVVVFLKQDRIHIKYGMVRSGIQHYIAYLPEISKTSAIVQMSEIRHFYHEPCL